jgi:hypothetical protein
VVVEDLATVMSRVDSRSAGTAGCVSKFVFAVEGRGCGRAKVCVLIHVKQVNECVKKEVLGEKIEKKRLGWLVFCFCFFFHTTCLWMTWQFIHSSKYNSSVDDPDNSSTHP